MSGVLRACGVCLVVATRVLLFALLPASGISCGGAAADSQIGVTPRPAVSVADWPPVATSPGQTVTVKDALGCADGAQIRVRGYLIAVTPPCPACNVRGQGSSAKEEDRIGKTARPRGPDMPGCAPCPAGAATFSDEGPTASPSPASAPLRAIGGAEGLQARHVGHLFVLTGTFRARGELGPELEVTDVRAIDGR